MKKNIWFILFGSGCKKCVLTDERCKNKTYKDNIFYREQTCEFKTVKEKNEHINS